MSREGGTHEVHSAIKTADKALEALKEGNERFVKEETTVKDVSDKRLKKLAGGQKPLAIILGCSDSRVPPEAVFDQGLGHLFVVRVAGNVDDTTTLGSIEYAAEHLKVPLLVVMGHSKCGVVKATVEGGDVSPNLAAIAEKIMPSVKIAQSKNAEEEAIIEEAVIENVKATVKNIEEKSSIVKEAIESGKLKVVGAKYDIETGKVEFLD